MKLKSFQLRYIILIAALLVFTSCQYDPHGQLLTTVEPSAEDIVGTYVLDRCDLPKDIIIKKVDIKLVLHPDGSFTATNIPPWVLGEPGNNFFSELLSGEGKWVKAVMGTLDPGSRKIWGIYLRTSDDRFHPANFTGEESPYGLIFTLGDPDSGNAILLKKE
ncbi:unnamed protein product [Rotaria sp. Silwood2]|nr:unnamed protein product [Rotaria sp. Silwood2]CAF4479202.1 unnamed protein product [Rotaria sp. Silwood2]